MRAIKLFASNQRRVILAAMSSVAALALFAWGDKLAQPWDEVQAMGADNPSFPPCISMLLQLAGLVVGVFALILWGKSFVHSWRRPKRT